MNFRKIIFKITSLILVVLGCILVTSFSAKADESEMQLVPNSQGGYIKYRGTNINVEVPTVYEQKQTEFRGVWVSPFAGDISGYTQTDEAWKNDLLSVLDVMEQHNLNAIVFHLRTHNDALYNTKLAPKSGYISAANFQKWDYLKWFIDECHSRGIEFHAWLNPYRISSSKITMNEIKKKYADFRNNPAYKDENVLISDTGAILDPGSPEVREYLVNVCMEIVKKYDVDAIHFDDYFYEKGIDDSATYKKYKANYGNPTIANFRRLQVDEFIETLSNEMYDYNIKNNKAVQLGISPSGVYKNGGYSTEYKYDENGTLTSPTYSNTAGYEHYDAPLYSDTKKWIDNEWIDYITPQLYGSFESTGACYADAAHWWAQVVKYKKVNLYTGLGIYKTLDGSDVGWAAKDNRTFELQLLFNQMYDSIDGFCLYQYKTLPRNANSKDFKKVFGTMLTSKAINPRSQRYDITVDAPKNLELYKGTNTYNLVFDSSDRAYKYAIYKAKGTIDVNNQEHLVAIIGNDDINSFIDKEKESGYTYGIRAISQSNQLSELVTIDSSKAETKIDFDFGKFNKLSISENITSNGYFIIVLEKAEVFVGEEASYKVYTSVDKENWELVQELPVITTGSKNIRLQFNDIMKPVYYKVVMENEFGTVESEILTADITRLSVDIVMAYIKKSINNDILDIFQLDE